MKQKHADSPSAFLAAAMAVTGAAMLLCPLIGQNTEMNRSAAEYDDLRVQLKSEEPAHCQSLASLVGENPQAPKNTSGEPDGSAPSALIRRTVIARSALSFSAWMCYNKSI